MPISYRQLKYDVALGYKRHTVVTSSTPSQAGSTTQFFDNNRQEPDRFWSLDGANTWVKFIGTSAPSLNDGQVRRVTGWSTGNFSITFAPAVTASVASGAGYHLYKGAHPDSDIGQAINEARRAAFPERTVFSIATLHEIEDTRSYSIPSAVMSAVRRLVKVEQSVGTINSDYHYRTLRDGYDYEIVDTGGPGLLQLQYLPTPSLLLRFTGEGPAQDLSADTDTTDEPPAVILAGARHFLALQEGNAELAAFWAAKFEAAKKDYSSPKPVKQLRRPHFQVG